MRPWRGDGGIQPEFRNGIGMARCTVPFYRRRNDGVVREIGHNVFRPLRAGGDSAALSLPFPATTRSGIRVNI